MAFFLSLLFGLIILESKGSSSTSSKILSYKNKILLAVAILELVAKYITSGMV